MSGVFGVIRWFGLPGESGDVCTGKGGGWGEEGGDEC